MSQTATDFPESRRPTLGVVVICYNEERDLPQFLEHLLLWVDEIVIVDDGSTDRSGQLCADAGPKVKFLTARRGPGEYYSHQRNKGIAVARSDWLLHMDIDERIPPELQREVDAAVRLTTKDGFSYKRRNYFLHRPIRGGGWAFFSQLHLARRSKFYFGGKIHETEHLEAPPERVGQLDVRVWHLNEDSYLKRMNKSVRYSAVDAETLIEASQPIRWWHLLLRPIWDFSKNYFLLFGIRDGVPGLILALHGMASVFNSYALAWDQQNRIDRGEVEAEFKSLKPLKR